ncbi:MAG: FliM/FliN family flagellar motor switch protein [Amaricoccus sp.]
MSTVLAKKLRQGGVARSPLPDTELVGESFARAVEDRLRPLVKTVIGAQVAHARVTKLGEATGALGSPAMLGLIAIEDADAPALIAAHADLAYHLIDLTLGGDPAIAPTPVTRPFTAIDMALCRLHLEAMLQSFVQAVGTALGRPLAKAMRIRDQRQNLSQLRLAPDYIDVLVFTVTLSLGEANRTGRFDLILPLAALDVIRAAIRELAQQQARDRPNDLWKALMRRAAAAAPVPVEAVLYRQSLSLAALQELRVGQILEIPRQSTEEIELALPQPGGRTALLATAQLGVFQDRKVVKLTRAPDPRLAAHIDRALRATPGPEDEPDQGFAARAPADLPTS